MLRDSIHQQATASTTAMTNPIGIFATAPTCADSGISSVCGMPLVLDDSACIGPVTSHHVTPAAM